MPPPHAARTFASFVALALVSGAPRPAHGDLEAARGASGSAIAQADVVSAGGGVAHVAWGELGAARAPGDVEVRVTLPAGAAVVEVPTCAGRGAPRVDDGAKVAPPDAGPLLVPLPNDGAPHLLTLPIRVSAYEKRIACGAPVVAGRDDTRAAGLLRLTFASPDARAGGGHAVLYVPPGHDVHAKAPLLVGTHPWNGGIWTYAAYAELLRAADAHDVVLLFPSGLGNSLYTAAAEREVMRAIDAAARAVAVDPQRVSIWGASMGGAGATTIGLHRPDRFAAITSLFGDSTYDLTTYVKAILPDEAAAHRVNAVADNARHVPVWLIHGEEDRVSPIAQSERLAQALRDRSYRVRFDRVPGAGHEGTLVARFAAEIVARAAEAHAPVAPSRVTFRSVRPEDTGAYGVHVVRAGSGDAFVDVELQGGRVHVRDAQGVRAIVLDRGALGASPDAPPPIVRDGGAPVTVRWRAATEATEAR